MELRQDAILQSAPELRQQLELQILLELKASLAGLNIKLFGDASVENQKGRFPALERSVEELIKRVDQMEKAMIRYVALASGAGFVIGVLLHFLWK